MRSPWGRTHGRATWSRRTLGAVRENPVLNRCDERLRPAGTAAQGALPACRRQPWTLRHAMVTPQKPWHVQEVPSASHPRLP